MALVSHGHKIWWSPTFPLKGASEGHITVVGDLPCPVGRHACVCSSSLFTLDVIILYITHCQDDIYYSTGAANCVGLHTGETSWLVEERWSATGKDSGLIELWAGPSPTGTQFYGPAEIQSTVAGTPGVNGKLNERANRSFKNNSR